MDHSFVVKNEIIEKYLLHELSGEEESELEKHLLYCSSCRDDLEKMRKIRTVAIQGIFHVSHALERHRPAKVLGIRYFYKYAAACVILIGMAAMVIHFIKRQERLSITIADNEPIDTAKVDTTLNGVNFHRQTKELLTEEEGRPADDQAGKEILAQAFEPSPFYEGLMEVQYRSPSVKVVAPLSDQSFKTGEPIYFNWFSTEYDSLRIVLLSNKEKLLMEELVGNTYTLPRKLSPGLYYWQLENTKEALHVGKIIIRNR